MFDERGIDWSQPDSIASIIVINANNYARLSGWLRMVLIDNIIIFPGGIYQVAQLFTWFEMRNMLFCQGNRLTGFWISTQSGRTMVQ
jgi:hypothetical protein